MPSDVNMILTNLYFFTVYLGLKWKVRLDNHGIGRVLDCMGYTCKEFEMSVGWCTSSFPKRSARWVGSLLQKRLPKWLLKIQKRYIGSTSDIGGKCRWECEMERNPVMKLTDSEQRVLDCQCGFRRKVCTIDNCD